MYRIKNISARAHKFAGKVINIDEEETFSELNKIQLIVLDQLEKKGELTFEEFGQVYPDMEGVNAPIRKMHVLEASLITLKKPQAKNEAPNSPKAKPVKKTRKKAPKKAETKS
jgi:hypothetical protein